MHTPPQLEYKTFGAAVLGAPAHEYKNLGGDLLETALGRRLEVKTAAGAVIEAHTENGGKVGVVEAYVAVTGTRDEVGDVIEHQAFDHSLKTIHPKMCLGHDWNRPIGEPQEIRFVPPGSPDLPEETAEGKPWPGEAGALYTKNRYLLGTQDGRDAYEHAKFYGPRTAYSIGYVVKKSRIGLYKGLKTRFIEELDLYEYGPVLHGAHNLARQKSVKTGEPAGAEHKVRKVKDSGYWGYPIGTPITMNMKPKGPTARKLRKEGKVPDRNQGTSDAITAAGKPAPKRTTPDKVTADADAAGLFSEPQTEARVRARNPKGKDDEHVASLIGTLDDSDPEESDAVRQSAISGLLDEGITPAELEEDLGHSDWPDDVDETEKASHIEDAVAEYRAAYRREVRRQSGAAPAEGDTPGTDAPKPKPDKARPTVWKTNPDRAFREMSGAERTDYGKLSHDQQVSYMRTRAEGDDHATALGKAQDGDSGDSAASNPDAAASNPDAPDVSKLTDQQRGMLHDARDTGGGETVTSGHETAAQPLMKAGLLERGDQTGIYKLTEQGQAARAALGDDAGDFNDRPDRTTGAMWRTSPDRAADRLTGPRRAEYDSLSPQGQSAYAEHRVAREDHATAMTAAKEGDTGARDVAPGEPPAAAASETPAEPGTPRPKPGTAEHEADMRDQLGEGSAGQAAYDQARTEGASHDEAMDRGANANYAPAAGVGNAPDTGVDENAPETGVPAGDEPAAPDTGTAGSDAGATPTPVDTPADLTPDEQTWADDAATAAAALPEDQKAAYDALDDQGKHSYATARISGEDHAGALDYAQHRSTATAPADTAAPETPPAPGELRPTGAAPTPANLANTLTTYPGKFDLAPYDLDMLKATDAEFTSRAEQLGKPGAVSKAHQLLKDEIAKREAAGLDAEAPAAAPGTPSELPATPNLGVQPGTELPTEGTPPLEGVAPDASGVAIPGADVTPGAEDVQIPAQPQGPSVADEAARTLDPVATAQITADDIAETDATADASYGITEADDGEFEIATDVADRQDRVAALLDADAAGGLSLGTQSDDNLRSTRTDVVNEIKLQDHLANRRTGEPALTRTQRGNSSDTGNDGDTTETDDTTPPPPKTRPGLAGALDDHADALDGTDPDAITRTRARLEASVRRSKSDSDVVKAVRAVIESGEPDLDPTLLRAAAEQIRLETRQKRNEQARNRRTARRLDRERLRSLLGSVDAEMRRRNLSYAPVPGLDGDADTTAPAAGGPTPGTWHKGEGNWATANTEEVSGTGYHANINTVGGIHHYQWSATNDDDTELGSGSGVADDPDTARTLVAHALATQQTLGRIPGDSVLPPLPATDTAAARREAERSSVDAIRDRLTDPTRNPVTGAPNPLTPPRNLRTPAVSAFPDAAAVRAHLEANAPVIGDMPNPARNIRWDDVTLTPGGGLAVGTNLRGEPVLFHTGSGLRVPIGTSKGLVPMTKADLLKVATIMESLPDANGRTANFAEADRHAVAADVQKWVSPNGLGDGRVALGDAALRALVAEKIRAGRWSDPMVRKAGLTPIAGDGTNPTRRGQIDDLHRTLGQLINVRSGPVPREDKKTLDIAAGARQLSGAGAPDAAAVVLRRRAVELREMSAKADAADATAKAQGLDRPNLARAAGGAAANAMTANLLDDIANAHLSMHSPTPSPGTRALRLQPGERLAFPEGDGVRTYRVLSPMRASTDEKPGAHGSYAQVMDEATGQQLTAGIIGGAGMSPMLQVYDPDAKIGVFSGSIHSTPLGGNGFVVLDDGQPAPAHDGFSEAGFSDIDSIPAEALDRAAEELPETPTETTARRVAAPVGERAPARRSQAAPKRSAPAAVLPPSTEEAKLAQSQVTARNLWQQAPYEANDAAPGGFKNFDEVIANAHALVAANPGYRNPKSTSAEAAFIQIDNAPPSSGLPAGGAKLSPGGHLVIQKNGAIAHAHTGALLWTPSMAQRLGAGDSDQPSPALMARIADYIERGDFGGQSLTLDTTSTDDIVASATAIQDKTGVHPLATATRAAYVDHLATASRPTASDISGLESMTADVRPADFLPNPDVFTANLNIGQAENNYAALSGKRINNVRGDDLPNVANSKEGQTLAKRIAAEYTLTRAQAKVAPLDAVRRLNALADELDGRTIESSDGKTFTPATDLRDRAQAISDAYDDTKPSPMGLLARSNFDGTVVPDWAKVDVSVGQGLRRSSFGAGPTDYLSEGTRNIRTRRLEAELREGGGITFERGDSGNLRATLAGHTVEDGVDGGRVSANSDGSLAVSWREDLYGGAGEPKVNLPAGTWKLDGGDQPSTPGDVSDAEYETHVADIEAKLGAALSDGQATDIAMTIGRDGQSWTPERAKLHNEIVNEMWQARGAAVPTEGRAVIAGGLGGAGKSTVLKGYAGIDATQYFTINSDDVKQAMAERDMIPTVEGLSPLEASALIHTESGHVANLLASRAYASNTNVVWDTTMGSKKRVEQRIAELRKAGYGQVSGVFVDIPVETSVERALARHRQGMAEDGLGGWYVPPSTIQSKASDTASSVNRDTFDALRPDFDSWIVYDNSVSGREPQKVADSGNWGSEAPVVPVAPEAGPPVA